MEELVSVVMPVYNGSKYMRDAIESVLNQTYSNIELIVVNDGSNDCNATHRIALSYGNRIRYYAIANQGVAGALNYGLSKCAGKYIARMDSDDVALPDRILTQVKYLESHPEVDVLGTECNVIDADGQKIDVIAPGYYTDSQIKSKLIFENCIVHPTVIMRADLIARGWKYDTDFYAEDLDLWVRMASKGIRFANLSENLINYRKYVGQATGALHKVAISVAKSAKIYVESMFDVEPDKYQLEDFTRPYYSFLVESSPKKYILKQFCLLNEIYTQNLKLKRVKTIDLVKELNCRWNWAFRENGIRLTSFCDHSDIFCPNDEDNTIFFLDKIKKKIGITDRDIIYRKLEQALSFAEKKSEAFLMAKKNIIIYGMGVRGKRVLSAFFEKKKRNELAWNLIAVADSKKTTISHKGIIYNTVSKEELSKFNPDIVIISSNKYYEEIREELIQIGVDAAKIREGNWLL